MRLLTNEKAVDPEGMITWYCSKCARNNPEALCTACGRKLSPGAMRDVWRVYRTPLGDGAAWKSALVLLAVVSFVCLAVLFLWQAALSGFSGALPVLTNGTAAWVFALIPAGLLCLFIALSLQGREILVYCLDAQGAHMQTWHEAGRIRSMARMQAAKAQNASVQEDGSSMILSQTRHLLWTDVKSVRFLPAKGEIHLFSGPHIVPYILRLPPEEYDSAETMVKKHCRKALAARR